LGWRKRRSKNHAIRKASERVEARPVVDARAGAVRMAAAAKAVEIEAAIAGTGAGSKVRPRSTLRS
jgi:hypothetical protein